MTQIAEEIRHGKLDVRMQTAANDPPAHGMSDLCADDRSSVNRRAPDRALWLSLTLVGLLLSLTGMSGLVACVASDRPSDPWLWGTALVVGVVLTLSMTLREDELMAKGASQ